MDWNDLRLFLSVARLGGLRPASQATGLSAPTLGRRMAALELRLGQTLFARSLSGYALTAAGEELLARATEVERSMAAIANWSEGTRGDPLIRISAGRWMSDLLAERIGALWQVEDRLRLEFVSTFELADVLRRDADIDLRGAPPDEPGLARRQVGRSAHAIYSGRRRVNGVEAGYFVGYSGEAAAIPAARWLEAHHGDRIGLRCNDVQTCLRLVAECAGLGVLPCFVGDRDPRLIRLGSPIPELARDLWLVTHDERRHEAPVRLVIDRLTALFDDLGPLLKGERPRAWEARTAEPSQTPSASRRNAEGI